MIPSDQQFDRTRRLASQLAGIELVDRHRELLRSRSRRSGIQDGEALDLLLQAAEQGDPAAQRQLLSLLTTKFTGFFRHPAHFTAAARYALEACKARGEARLWSAAASTGEEAYSLAMAVIEVFENDHPPVQILATDIDAEALAVAQEGQYNETAARSLGSPRCERFTIRTSTDRTWSIAPHVRQLVTFRELNLADESWPVQGPFDAIFCRNVLMYLHDRHRLAAARRMAGLLAPDGLLLLDPAEHLGAAECLFRLCSSGVYRACPGTSDSMRQR